jgi:hypothetical protein
MKSSFASHSYSSDGKTDARTAARLYKIEPCSIDGTSQNPAIARHPSSPWSREREKQITGTFSPSFPFSISFLDYLAWLLAWLPACLLVSPRICIAGTAAAVLSLRLQILQNELHS